MFEFIFWIEKSNSEDSNLIRYVCLFFILIDFTAKIDSNLILSRTYSFGLETLFVHSNLSFKSLSHKHIHPIHT